MTALLLALALLGVPDVPPRPVDPAIVSQTETGPYPATEADARAVFDEWADNPVKFVRDNFGVEPDEWQRDVLESLLVDRRIAMSACKGPGKSAVLAWVAWWLLACHYDTKGAACSITADNLKDNLWTELAAWYDKSETLKDMFIVRDKRIVNRQRPKTWWLSFRSFPQSANAEEQASTLAGLHAPYVFILLDEMGDMAPGVIPAANGIFYVKGQEAWLLGAGNPTTEDGALYFVTHTAESARWRTIHITGDPDDPKRSPRLDIDQARQEIAALGRDNPFVMVNILGLFPPVGSNKLIAGNDVTLGMNRDMPLLSFQGDARVWGLDPARSDRSGADEASLARRQGLLERPFIVWRGKNGTELGDQVAMLILAAQKHDEERPHEPEEMPDRIFVDVGGVGSSAYDRLVHLGWGKIVTAVDFGGSAIESKRYHNKRTEIWCLMADWLSGRPACLPNDPILRSELTAPRYSFRVINKSTKLMLESKDDMKARGVRSPNRADSLALTFAAPVVPMPHGIDAQAAAARRTKAVTEYDPTERS